MTYEELISTSNLAFASGYYFEAKKTALQAIQLGSNKPEGYEIAGKACISTSDYGEAVSLFTKLVEFSQNKGNAFFLLGYAQVLNGDSKNAIKSLVKSLENNCDDGLKVRYTK